MEMTVEHVDEPVPITILSLLGKLDASNFEELIARGQELYAAGTRNILIDMSGLTFMGSSGLVALHSITLLLHGDPPLDPEAGWSAFRILADRQATSSQKHVKLLNPPPKINQMLNVTGMNAFYDIFLNRDLALDSFG